MKNKLLAVLPLLVLLCLQGCGPAAAPTDGIPAPELPALSRESFAPIPTAAEPEDPERPQPAASGPGQTVPVEPASTAPASAEPFSEPSKPASEPEIPWQEGDTTPGWQPALAEAWPADADCTPEQLLEKWLCVEGLTRADLDRRGCDQLILSAAQPTDGVETLTVCYERGPDGSLVPAAGLERIHGFNGRKGVRHDRRKDSLTSPAGLWAISTAFGNEAPPEGLKLDWRQVSPNSEWVCDVDSVYFNTWQERDDPALTGSWGENEHLENYPEAYAWACVIEFNRGPEAVPARGCAIFLHVSDRGTAGCIGLSRADMRAVLLWLDPEKHPYILITGTELP